MVLLSRNIWFYRLSVFAGVCVLSSLVSLNVFAREFNMQFFDKTVITNDTITSDEIKIVGDSISSGVQDGPTKYIPSEQDEPKLLLFQGFTASFDVFSLAQFLWSDYGQFEAALRLNLKNTFLPIAEIGYAVCNSYNDDTNISYKTNAPYFRVGIDFNMLKNKFSNNRLFVGLRYGFSSYKYDISGPNQTDPVWGGSKPFEVNGITCTSHWAEFCAGVQVKIWGRLHMGWILRYKFHIDSSQNDFSQPYYIPGYGTKVGSSVWGASYNLCFDLDWGKKKNRK